MFPNKTVVALLMLLSFSGLGLWRASETRSAAARTSAPTTPIPTPVPTPGPGDVVISQVYAGAGNTDSSYQGNFLELFNRTDAAINISGWPIYFSTTAGTFQFGIAFVNSGGIFIQPHRYLLIKFGPTGSSGQPLTPDLDGSSNPPLTILPAGIIFLARTNANIPNSSCPLPNTDVIDLVGYGTAANCFEGSGPTANPGNTTAALRKFGGCRDTDNNASDFVIGSPNPRNSGSPTNSCANPIDAPDFFVKQHYLDFLNRQADQSGLDFWTQQITSCGSDAPCIEVKRINVSAAFFLSIEFQQTGNLVYKMYKAAFGNLPGKPVAADRAPFLNDTRQIQSTPVQVVVNQGDWQAQLEANKQAFALAFVQRTQFQTKYVGMSADNYVQTLFNDAGVTPTAAETEAAINAFNGAGGGDAGRAAGLRSVAESNSVSTKLFNEAFVLMQYFGYLQRNPYDPPEPTLDYQGYTFWLNKLNSFNGDYLAAEMVKAFISSSEYRQRFAP
jgi:Lamin Tail Domain/Domain of unknown function (DUF4214)